jgi:SOS response regulatory protein OraA/RecX
LTSFIIWLYKKPYENYTKIIEKIIEKTIRKLYKNHTINHTKIIEKTIRKTHIKGGGFKRDRNGRNGT